MNEKMIEILLVGIQEAEQRIELLKTEINIELEKIRWRAEILREATKILEVE